MTFQDINAFMNNPINLKSSEVSDDTLVTINSQVEDRQSQNPIFKQTIPEFLYKPPFGFPRNINVPFLRTLSKNPYIQSIIKTLQDEASSTDWDIVPKEGIELDEAGHKEKLFIKEFFNNPNDDDESFDQLIKKSVTDFAVLDSPCWVKVYNQLGELLQMRYIDGGTIVKNPDIHGRVGGRADFVFDIPVQQFANNMDTPNTGDRDKAFAEKYSKAVMYEQAVNQFRSQYQERAAYFQFSNTLMTSIPIPFGRKEIMYMMMNPDPSSVYSFASPVQASVDIVMSLIFGAKYNLDFYMNSNTPEGIITAVGLSSEQTKVLQERLHSSMYTQKDEFGVNRRIGYRMPVTNASDVKFTPLNFSSREMEIIAQQEWFTKVLWMCFGVTAAEMGFESGSKATDENQTSTFARKAIKPMLKTLAFYFNSQIIKDLPGGEKFEFKWDAFDIDEENKKRDLQQKEINMGIKTWQMIAEDEGIDMAKLKSQKDENAEGDFNAQFGEFGSSVKEGDGNSDNKEESEKAEVKSQFGSTNSLFNLVDLVKAEIAKKGIKLAREVESGIF